MEQFTAVQLDRDRIDVTGLDMTMCNTVCVCVCVRACVCLICVPACVCRRAGIKMLIVRLLQMTIRCDRGSVFDE